MKIRLMILKDASKVKTPEDDLTHGKGDPIPLNGFELLIDAAGRPYPFFLSSP